MTLPAETLKSSLSASAGIPATLDISDDLSRSLKPFTIIQISCSFSHAAGLWRWCQPPALSFESPALNAHRLHGRTCPTLRNSMRASERLRLECQKHSYLTLTATNGITALAFHDLKLLKEYHVRRQTLFTISYKHQQLAGGRAQSTNMTALSSFTHSRVVLNLYAVITSVELKWRIFTQIIVTSFQLRKEQKKTKQQTHRIQ